MPTVPTASRAGLGRQTRQTRDMAGVQAANVNQEGADNLARLGQATSQVANDTFNAADSIATKREALETVRVRSELNKKLQDEFTRLQTEDDLTDPEITERFGAFVEKARGEAMAGFRGRDDARTRLQGSILDLESQYAGSLASQVNTAQREATKAFLGEQLSTLTTGVYRDVGTVDDALQSAQAEIDGLAGALDPLEERAFRSGARAEIFSTAIRGMLDAGNLEDAEIFLDRPDAAEAIDQNTKRRLRERIVAQRKEDNALADQYRQLEEVFGPDEAMMALRKQFGLVSDVGSPVMVLGENGQPEYVPESQSFGRQPYIPGQQPTALDQVRLQQAQVELAQTQQQAQSADIERRREAAARMGARESSVAAAERAMSVGQTIVENLQGNVIPRLGTVGQWVPDGELDAAITSLSSALEIMAVQDAKAEGLSFGSLTEGERKAAGASIGNLSRAQEPETLGRELENALGIFARAQYGNDQELSFAVEAGELTKAQASAMRQAREQMIAQAGQYRAQISGSVQDAQRAQQRNDKQFQQLLAAAQTGAEDLASQLQGVSITAAQKEQLRQAWLSARKDQNGSN